MTEQADKDTRTPADKRWVVVPRAAASMACLLLASAAICWVAANWQHVSSFTKLAGAQILLVALVFASWLAYNRRRHDGMADMHGAAAHNLELGSHLVGLAAVAIGALLALAGQIYQTGADTWQLFLVWAVLLVPWLLTQHTVFLGLLFALLLNVALGLYLGIHEGGIWAGWGSWVSSALVAAALNALLLGAWECFIKWFGDSWRIGPRALAAAVAGWLFVAAFMGIGTGAGPLAISIVGWVALAIMYLVYTRLRSDLVIVSFAALAAFVLLVLPLLYWAGSEAGLLLVVIALLAAMAWGLRKLGALLRARAVEGEPWYIGAFRLVAMGITAILLMVFLLLVLDFEVEFLWVPGLALCVAGLLLYKMADTGALRELGLTVLTTGLFLAGASFFVLHQRGAAVGPYALLALGVGLYVPVRNAVFRFITAFFVLSLATIMTWPQSGLEDMLLGAGSGHPEVSLPIYLRMWWFSVIAVLVMLAGRGDQAGRRWRPLGWALLFLAQIVVWFAPAPSMGSILEVWRQLPSVVIIWLACAALPVVALAAVLWRGPALPMVLRLGAPLALAVAAVGWMGAPGVSLALLWLILGYAMKHRSLMGFGVLALLLYLMRFYYQLDTSLLHKSFVLGATGIWLLGSVWVLKQTAQRSALAFSQGVRSRPQAEGAPKTSAWRRAGLVVGLLVVLAVANANIYKHEHILAEGQRVVLELAPVDPRSLIQGDYMRLDFQVSGQLNNALKQAPQAVRQAIETQRAGLLVLRPDKRGVHRLYEVVALNGVDTEPNSVLLKFLMRRGGVKVVTDAWFFPEGQAAHFEQARYGEFRVNAEGTGLLVNMLDQQLRPLAQP